MYLKDKIICRDGFYVLVPLCGSVSLEREDLYIYIYIYEDNGFLLFFLFTCLKTCSWILRMFMYKARINLFFLLFRIYCCVFLYEIHFTQNLHMVLGTSLLSDA
jgi:hypothetical protein